MAITLIERTLRRTVDARPRSCRARPSSRGRSWPRSPGSAISMPGPAARGGRSSWPCGGRRRSRSRPPCTRAPGWTTKPSGSSSASTPQRRSSRDHRGDAVGLLAADEPDARDRVGPSANAATTASVWAVSDMSRRSNSTPRSAPVPPITVKPSDRVLDRRAHRASTSTKPTSPCSESRCEAGHGDRADRRGRGREEVRRGRRVGLDRQTARGTAAVRPPTTAPNASITAVVIATYGRDTASVVNETDTPSGYSGPASSRPDRNWLVTSPRTCTVPAAPRAGHDERQRLRRHRRRPETAPPRRGRPSGGPAAAPPRRACTALARPPSTGSRNRAVVPDRRASSASGPRRERCRTPRTTDNAAVDRCAPSAAEARRPSPRCRRPAGRPRQLRLPVGQRRAHQGPVGELFDPARDAGRATSTGVPTSLTRAGGRRPVAAGQRARRGSARTAPSRPRGSARPGRPRSSGRSRGRRCSRRARWPAW